MSRPPCVTCSAPIRARQWICRACLGLAEAAFRREHAPTDGDWIRARNLFFGDRDVLLPAIRAELAASERGAA